MCYAARIKHNAIDMRKPLIALVALLMMMPMLAQADVVTSDDLGRLTADAVAQNNGCALVNFALYTQGSMKATAEWKTVKVSNDISLRFPWSPIWYVVGKQIPWFEKVSENYYATGRMQPGDGCGVNRDYSVEIVPDQSLKKYLAIPSDGNPPADIMESLTINGKNAALIEYPLSMCEEEGIAVEVKKGKKTHTVVIKHRCGAVNAEMLRMAANVK